jgi:hypothetical protein
VGRESTSAEGPQRPTGDELWQRLLMVIDEYVNVAVLHPLDRALIVRHLQALHRIGERPPYDEFTPSSKFSGLLGRLRRKYGRR